MAKYMIGFVLVGAMVVLATAPAVLAQQPPAASRSATIDLNSASIADLESLPGIGRRTAERILEYRQKSGGFKKIEELMNVKGIGEKSFLRLKPLIAVASKGEKAGGGQ
ncbi:MAG: helix-hairpin-helix domain-containing protein [Acidobacteria bacterium]|nr:helix-hairpin-helix domain-containing protein [Acidobacteriota bacterium]